MATLRPVLQQLLKLCRPFTLPEPWDRCPAAEQAFLPPADPVQAARTLTAEFAVEELCRVGVLMLDSSHQPVLHAALVDSPALIALGGSSRRPSRLLTQSGCVPADRLPACAVRPSELVQSSSGAANCLAVCFSILDVALLLSLRIPATLATGMHEIGHEDLDELSRLFGLARHQPLPSQRRAGRDDRGGRSVRLLLLAWSPAALDLAEPKGLAAVLAHLHRLHRHLGVSMETVHVWRPGLGDIEALRSCLRYGRVNDTRQALSTSMRQSAEPLIEANRTENALALADPANLRQRLQQANSVEERRAIWDSCEDQLSDKLVRPLLQLAEASENPLERHLLLAASDTGRLLHSQAVVLYDRLTRNALAVGQNQVGPVPVAEIKQWLATTSRQLSIARQLSAFQSRPRTSPPSRSRDRSKHR